MLPWHFIQNSILAFFFWIYKIKVLVWKLHLIMNSNGEGNGSPLQRIPRTEDPGGLWSMESQTAGHNWVTNTHYELKSAIQSVIDISHYYFIKVCICIIAFLCIKCIIIVTFVIEKRKLKMSMGNLEKIILKKNISFWFYLKKIEIPVMIVK